MWYYCRTTYNPQIWWNKGKKTITLPWGCLWQSCCMQNSVTSSHLEIHIKTQFLFTASQLWRIDHMTRAWDETMPLQQYCPPICSPLIFMHAGLQGVRRSPADSSISECAQGWELLLKDCNTHRIAEKRRSIARRESGLPPWQDGVKSGAYVRELGGRHK